MATTVSGPETHGRGKPLNTEFNLVPFIDLFVVCITFLLIAAVWTQISMLQTNQGTSDRPAAKDDFTLALYVFKDRQDLTVGSRTVSIPKSGKEYNLTRLAYELKTVKNAHPNKNDILVLSQDKVLYKDLIVTLDTCIGSGLPNISVSGMLE